MDLPASTSLVVCLGNPGPHYANTPHNIGWWLGDVLAMAAKRSFQPGFGRFQLCEIRTESRRILLVKPMTYMNASGQAVMELTEQVEFSMSDLIVVVDDIALPLGQLRIRSAGSSGGHNGLASIIEVMGTDQFVRVRCGVGPVPEGVDPAEFVLAPFGERDLSSARDMAGRAAEAVMMIVTHGPEIAANTYNRKPPAAEPSSDEENSDADRPREGP